LGVSRHHVIHRRCDKAGVDPLAVNAEGVQMLLAPVKHDLKDVVEVCQSGVAVNEQLAPDERAHPAQADTQLIDARPNGGRFHVLSVAQCAAPLKASPRNSALSIVRDGVPYHDLGHDHCGRLATASPAMMWGAWSNSATVSPSRLEQTAAWKPVRTFWGISGDLWSGWLL
jgi:hypothetical protein